MSEPITIPAGTELNQKIPAADFERVLDWMRDNSVDPWRTTAERAITISDESIDRWDVVGGLIGEGYFRGHRRDAGYELRPGQEWSTDDEFAIAVHNVTTPVDVPLPDDLRAALLAAIA